ncbi:hypothetical protein K435DRAFT_316342 [Dendrothele bispora CBS 962.96]|uniref:Uncharacterized protein n=1 Tax=Dendrothele bispora (strain CBS 962.96) TaxID=1314807 RepID=A0A4S8MK54_DENBC|nr:hypothetical protein K435DRAFT_316342 [Dendrothele bispora CBS 962.96]
MLRCFHFLLFSFSFSLSLSCFSLLFDLFFFRMTGLETNQSPGLAVSVLPSKLYSRSWICFSTCFTLSFQYMTVASATRGRFKLGRMHHLGLSHCDYRYCIGIALSLVRYSMKFLKFRYVFQ